MRDLMQTEQVEVEEKALRYIAKAADGSMRDALSLLDQCIAFYLGQKLTYDHVLEVLGDARNAGVEKAEGKYWKEMLPEFLISWKI